MGIFSDIKKYRRPLTDINEKIQYLNERMTSSDFYWEVDTPGQEEIYGDTPDSKMGDLADPSTFAVADQTGSSPDMSQLSGTQVDSTTANLLSVPAGSDTGSVGVVRYGSFGAGGGTVYAVLGSDNRLRDSFIAGATSGNGGNQGTWDWVQANASGASTVTWHYYRHPGLADNAFNPVARNVGPNGAYTLWAAQLYVVKNPQFYIQQPTDTTYFKYGMDSPRYFFFRSKGSSGGGRTITARLWGFSNAMRGIGGFTDDVFKKTRPTPPPSIPDKGLEKMPTIGPDIPDKGLEKMPTIEPDKPETPPVPPVPPAPPTPPKPTPPPPAPTLPAPPSTPPQPYNPSPEDLAKIGAPAPPPPPGYGDRGTFFDDYLTKPAPQSKHDYVNQAFANTNYTLQAHGALPRDGQSPEALAAGLTAMEDNLKNYQDGLARADGDSFSDRMKRSNFEREILRVQGEIDSFKKTITEVATKVNQRTLKAKNDFENGGSVIDYVNSYSESHPAETDKVAEKAVDDNFDNAQKEISSNKEAILKELMKDPLFRVGKNLAEYSAPTTAKLFLDFLTGDLPPTIDNAYLGKDYVNKVLEKGILSDDAQFKMPIGDFIIATGQPITSDDYNPLTDEVSVKFNYNFQDTKTVMSGAQGTAMETFYNALSPLASLFSGGEKYKFDSLPVPLASKYIEKAEKLGGAKGRPGKIKLKLSDIKKSNPKFYNQLINKNIIDRTRVEESFNLNESIEYEKQTGVPIDHVTNVMNGIGDAVEALNDCIISLHKSSRTWRRPYNKQRYEIKEGVEGSQLKPLVITLSENTNQYLLTNPFTGQPYHPQNDGSLSEFIIGNSTRQIQQGGNVAAKCIIDNFIRTPEVSIDKEENINLVGQIYLFNSKQGVEYSIMTQAMSALSGITDTLGFSIEGFKENWGGQYESEIRAAFAGIEDLDKEVPILNIAVKIPFDQAHLYTMNGYLQSPENVKESMLTKWKKRTSPEDRYNQGEYEFFLNALSSMPSVAQTYIKIELAMQLENLLKAPNQQMDPKMLKVMSMVNANDVYVDNTFIENEKLFDKLKKSIKKNIELTDPNTFRATPTPIKHNDVVESKKRSIKKYLNKSNKKNPGYMSKKK